MTTAVTQQDRQFQIEYLTQELVKMLMEEQDMDLTRALDCVYGSQTYRKIENSESGLYYQSPIYVMDMLSEELNKKG